MNTQTSGRFGASNENTSLSKFSGSLLRSCRHCSTTQVHNLKLLDTSTATFGTECPTCKLTQFKFSHNVDDAARHRISLELRGQMQAHIAPRYEQRERLGIAPLYRGKAKPK